jgi:hypothetical protein
MSVRVMNDVWLQSTMKGSALLLLLAIADNADDQGYCWPSVVYLAKKTRLSERSITRLITILEASEELSVTRDSGRGNQYTVSFPPYTGDDLSTPAKMSTAGKAIDAVETMDKETPDKNDGDPRHRRLVPPTPSAIEPSLTTNDPPVTGTDVPEDPEGWMPIQNYGNVKGVSVEELERMDPDEQTYEPIGNEFGDGRGFDSNEDQGGVSKKSSVPKWRVIPADAMQYASHWKMKYFQERKDRANWRQLKHSLEQGLVTEEWVEQSLEWALKRPEGGADHPRWSFSGFLMCAINREKFSDWTIKRANALRKGGDAQKFSGTMEELAERYSD